MRYLVLLLFIPSLLTSVFTKNVENVHRIWYTSADDLDTSDDLTQEDSNIVEVRVLPDPDFVPPSFVKYDREGLSDDKLRTISRTVSRISTRIEVSSGENKNDEQDTVVNTFNHFKPIDIEKIDKNSIVEKNIPVGNELDAPHDSTVRSNISSSLKFSDFKEAYMRAKEDILLTTNAPEPITSPTLRNEDTDGAPDLFINLNKIENDIVTTYHPLDFDINNNKLNETSRQKYVIKSITNASPDVVIMEEARKYDSTTEKSKGHKQFGSNKNPKIVNVKRISNGRNNNSTLYRITKKRRKKLTGSSKRPKMIQQIVTASSGPSISNHGSKRHKKKPIHQDTSRGSLKRVRKKRLKNGRKIKDAKETSKRINNANTLLNTKRKESIQETTEPNFIKNSTKAAPFHWNRLKIKNEKNNTKPKTSPHLNWNGDIEIKEGPEDESIPLPQPLISLKSYTAVPSIGEFVRKSAHPTRVGINARGGGKLEVKTKGSTFEAPHNEKVELVDNNITRNLLSSKNRNQANSKLRKRRKKIEEKKIGSKQKLMNISQAKNQNKQKKVKTTSRNEIDQMDGNPTTKIISRRRKILPRISQELSKNKEKSKAKISDNSKNKNNLPEDKNSALEETSSSMIKKLLQTSVKKKQILKDKTIVSNATDDKIPSVTETIKRNKPLKGVDWFKTVETEKALALTGDYESHDRIDHAFIDDYIEEDGDNNPTSSGVTFRDVYDYYASVEDAGKAKDLNNGQRNDNQPLLKSVKSLGTENIQVETNFVPTPRTSRKRTMLFESKKIDRSINSRTRNTKHTVNTKERVYPDAQHNRIPLTERNSNTTCKLFCKLLGSFDKPLSNISNKKRNSRRIFPLIKRIENDKLQPPKNLNNVYSPNPQTIHTPKAMKLEQKPTMKPAHITTSPFEVYSYPSSRDIPGHSEIFEPDYKKEHESSTVHKEPIKEIEIIETTSPSSLHLLPTQTLPTLTTRKALFSSTTSTASPNFSSPPVDGKWYPILPEQEFSIRNKYKERQEIDKNIVKGQNTLSKPSIKLPNEVTLTTGNNVPEHTSIPRNDVIDDIVYGTGNNNDNSSTTVTPSQYFGEKRTNEPSSSSYIRFGLPYGISSINEDPETIVVYDEVQVENNDYTPILEGVRPQKIIHSFPNGIDIAVNGIDIYPDNHHSGLADTDTKKINAIGDKIDDISYAFNIPKVDDNYDYRINQNNFTQNPFTMFENEFGNFKVGLSESTIDDRKDRNYLDNEDEDKLRYNEHITKESNLPYNDIEKVPIITPTHTSLNNKVSKNSDTSYKRETSANHKIKHPTLWREQFEPKIVYSTTFKPNVYSPRTGSLYTKQPIITNPSQPNYQDIQSRISHHKQDYSRSIDTYSQHPASFRDDSVDFGAATGNLGAFGWYSDHAVGFGENNVIGLG